jgi:hypothetical protein
MHRISGLLQGMFTSEETIRPKADRAGEFDSLARGGQPRSLGDAGPYSAGGRGPAPTLIAMTRNRPGPGGRSRIKAVAERRANPWVSRCELAATLALRKAPSSAPVAAGSTAIQAFPTKNPCWRLTAGPCFPLRFFGAGTFSTAATTGLLSGLAVLRPGLVGSPRPPMKVSSDSRKPSSIGKIVTGFQKPNLGLTADPEFGAN